jgi:uncharacterized protein YndB with AHSA1/START domain
MVESSTPDASTAVLSLVVDADADSVFPMFTDPARLATWFWPAWFASIYESDPRPGGKFAVRSTGLPQGQNIGVRGIYGEIRRPELLTLIWSWDGDFSPPTHVTVTLRTHEQNTQVIVTHAQNPTEKQRDDHLKSWRDCLSRLADHMAVS